ncbi:hypothetical protein F0U59_50585 [Archangium gephyra]|nr:hypothetical protein F0U59_50585 [Archangium gephyra]
MATSTSRGGWRLKLETAKRPGPLPRTSWEGGLGWRVLEGAARPLHQPGALLGRPLCSRLSSAPPLSSSPSTGLPSFLYATRT